MSTLDIKHDTLRRLQQRAAAENCTVDDLLVRLLTSAPVNQSAAPATSATPSFQQAGQVKLTTDDAISLHLHETNALLQTIIDNIPVMIAFFDETGKFRYVNRYWLERLGWSVTELVNHPDPLTLFYPDPEYRQSAVDYMLSGEQGWRHFQVHTKANGVLETSWANVRFPDGRSIGIGRDVTQHKRAEADLEHALAQNQRILASMFEGYLLGKPDGTILEVNQRFCEMLGYSREELLSMQVYDIDAGLSETEINQNTTLVNNVPVVIETRHRHREGHLLDVEISSVLIDPERIACFIRDITRRKQNEAFMLDYERLKARFQKEQEQNTLVQRLISTLSHDLRTMLAVIASSKDILLHYFGKLTQEQRQEKLETIGRQLRLATELLEDTVTMVRGNIDGREFQPVLVNIASLCRISVEELGASRGKRHTLNFDNLTHLDNVIADEVLISRILLNLLSNAIKYSPEGSEVRLELDHRDQWLVLRVIDHGIGIPERDLQRIFEPFYRAADAEAVEGSGLGLSIVKDCVEKHQGRIHVHSVHGAGTTFTVELPVSIPEPERVRV